MNIIEIFYSIEGEGKRSGKLCTFIRFAGCNLRCSYCDTIYSYDIKKSENLEISEIIERCNKFQCKRITLTGGEPLIQKDLGKLVEELIKNRYKINIETNGSIDIDILKKYHGKQLFFTIDYKCPESGMNDKMLLDNFYKLKKKDVLKFVVQSKIDLKKMNTFIKKYKINKCKLYISPVWDTMNSIQIINFLKKHKLYNFKLQIQLHKIIWGPDKKGV